MNNKLFDGSDDDADDLQLSTNQDYANSYNVLRKKELLQKYKDRGLDISESELDSDSESSDEDEVDVKFDQEFFKTLASLKSKDPRIYDKETRFFNEKADSESNDDEDAPKKKSSKSKPVTLKDYERKVILEHNGKFESSDDEAQTEKQFERAQSPTAVEEERRLKAEFKSVMNREDDDEEDEEFGGIFKKRTKTQAQTDTEDADFAKWLAGKQADAEIDANAKQQLAPLKQYWSSNKLTQGESFLRDYILNKGYANTNESEIPTYDEIVGESTPLSDDEKELEKQAEFEQKYNFRFEEPDADFIKRYPRTIEQSLRRKDDTRKEKRKEIKQRKEQEKLQKMKELDLIKEMKRKEIEEKIRKLKAVTGNDELGFKDEELEEDFDPEAHDRRMQEIFNDEYYEVDEGEEKPECPSDIEELAIEDWDNYDPKQYNGQDDEGHCEDDDFNMDCDYDPVSSKQQLQQELIENTRSRKGRKGRRNRFMEMIQAEKPPFNPDDEQTYGDYIDEYYKLDYEDIVGDQPCRFKYVETTPNDFGLTIEEILLAKNKELNQWASLKKAVQNRPEHVEKREQRLYKMKAKNEDLKRKIFKSLYGDGSDDEEESGAQDGTQLVVKADSNEQPAAPAAEKLPTETLSKSKRKRLKRKAAAAAAAATPSATAPAPVKNEEQESSALIKKEEATSSEIPAKRQKIEKDKQALKTSNEANGAPAATNGTPPAKKKKFEKQKPQTDKQVANKDNSNNPFAKKQVLNKNDVKGNDANSNPFKKQQAPRPQQTQRPQQASRPPKGPRQKQAPGQQKVSRKQHAPGQQPAQSTGANPFKKAGNKSEAPRSKRDFKTKGKANNSNPNGISDDRLKAYGINPRKFHNRQKYGKKAQ
ncbi:PREDICTED: protein KRI1 homolog [Drosophila arizonae]|uniref:Protein KRI1 homolog n=1 Tax=Drosophila arizonae TaxID=7263 RepID=A0ABM1P718_DROAR|nr:PREDICTED: protein KRI1 homolog [Drosophila arizonae]